MTQTRPWLYSDARAHPTATLRSIHAIVQKPIEDPKCVNFVVTTEEAQLSSVKAMCAEIAAQPFALAPPVIMSLILP